MKCHTKGYLKNYINHLTHIIYSRVHINVSQYVHVFLYCTYLATYSIVINV